MRYTVKIKTTWRMQVALIAIRVLATCRLINISQASRILNRLAERGLLVKYRIDLLHKKWKPVPFNFDLEGEL